MTRTKNHFTLPEQIKSELRKVAKETRRTMTSILEESLEKFLKEYNEKKGGK